jgi:3-hydroxy-9,10-secoandrosta-1,3,5(10)-triene-9,17-dione monooxygenase
MSENAEEPLPVAARQLRALLAEHAAQAEDRGAHDERTHALLLDRGMYGMLIPRRFGGAGIGLDGFARTVGELARGCPTTARVVAELAGGALRVRTAFAAQTQAELFAGAELRCTSASGGDVRATRSGDGWTLAGVLSGCVGARHATHVIGPAAVADDQRPSLLAIVALGEGTVLDDDGGVGVGVGLENVHVAERFAVAAPPEPDPWPASVLPVALAAVLGGAARAAVEICDEVVRETSTPAGPRARDPDSQRWLGAAVCHADSAELLLHEAIAQTGESPAAGEHVRLGMLAHESMRFSWAAVQHVLRAAGPQPHDRRARLDRIGRAMLRDLHDPALCSEESLARLLARDRLALALDA